MLLLFFTSLIKFILWIKLFYRQKAGRGHGGGQSVLGRPHGTLLSFDVLHLNFQNMVMKTMQHYSKSHHLLGVPESKDYALDSKKMLKTQCEVVTQSDTHSMGKYTKQTHGEKRGRKDTKIPAG